MILLLAITSWLILSVATRAFVGRGVKRPRPDIFEVRTGGQSAPRLVRVAVDASVPVSGAIARGRDRKWHARAMELRSIGSLKVSAVGIGCNNFGMRIDEDADRSRGRRRARRRRQSLRHRRRLRRDARARSSSAARSAGRRDEAVIATKFGAPIDDDRTGASAAYVQRAVEDSLRRLGTDRIDLYQLHVPDADDADRGDARRARRARARGQGARDRCEQLHGRDDRRGRRRQPRARVGPLRERAERVQPAAAAPRAGRARRVRPQRHRLPPLLPARERHAHRQVPARRGPAGGHPAREHARRSGAAGLHREELRPRRGARRMGGRATGTRCSSSRSRGCSRARPSPASSPGQRSPSRCRRTSPPRGGPSLRADLAEIDAVLEQAKG